MERTGQGTTDRLIRLKELITIVGLSSTSIWRRCNDGKFPRSVRLGTGSAVGWRKSEVDAWMNSLQKT